jgi:hypothetical protein
MNKLNVFIGLVFSAITVFCTLMIGLILYGSITPNSPTAMILFLMVVATFSGVGATGLLHKYFEADYV